MTSGFIHPRQRKPFTHLCLLHVLGVSYLRLICFPVILPPLGTDTFRTSSTNVKNLEKVGYTRSCIQDPLAFLISFSCTKCLCNAVDSSIMFLILNLTQSRTWNAAIDRSVDPKQQSASGTRLIVPIEQSSRKSCHVLLRAWATSLARTPPRPSW